MDIIVNGKFAVLPHNFSFDYVAENRLFSESDGYSLTITFPLKDCQENISIFAHINRLDVIAEEVLYDCEIRDNNFRKFGVLAITEINDIEVKTQFLEGRSAENYNSVFDEVFINELDLGTPEILDTSSISPSQAWQPTGLKYVALPWVNNKEDSGNLQNAFVYENGIFKWHKTDCRGLSWQPYLIYITKKLCEALGYTFNLEKWENNEKHRFLLICNTLPYAWEIPDFAKALPHWSVTEFFKKLEDLLEGEFEINHKNKNIDFTYSNEYVKSLAPVEIKDVIEQHSREISIDDENCEYKGAKNIRYAEADHSMWMYYSCDWFIKEHKRFAVKYETLNDLLRDKRGFAHWNGSSNRGDNFNTLYYAKDVDCYFVIRTISRTLVEERDKMPNLYQYKCVLQPINLFGEKFFNNNEQTDSLEIDFLPAMIDYTDNTYGRCLFLTFGDMLYDDSSEDTFITPDGGNWEEKKQKADEFRQSLPTIWLKNGEKEKTAEYYSKIFIGWWDGAPGPETGKAPYPYTDDIVISEDWSSYFRPHFSLRLNNSTRKFGYRIETKKKTNFKFLANTMPNPRTVFYIKGKRYLCEKINATFTNKGMSNLFKGTFWEIV